jgi:hypothetical protein
MMPDLIGLDLSMMIAFAPTEPASLFRQAMKDAKES